MSRIRLEVKLACRLGCRSGADGRCREERKKKKRTTTKHKTRMATWNSGSSICKAECKDSVSWRVMRTKERRKEPTTAVRWQEVCLDQLEPPTIT